LTWRARAATGTKTAGARPTAAGDSTRAATAGSEAWTSSSSAAATTAAAASAFGSQNHLKQFVRIFEKVLEFVALSS
jgi:hypothetical protein